MKVLLSAYACEPNKGSEPEIGWRWALELAGYGHDVWVITRANNQRTINKELAKAAPIANLHFIFYDLPAWVQKWKVGRPSIMLYYLLWQLGAYGVARRIHDRQKFDLVHHITFGTIRIPSFVGKLGIPFIFGPVAGGEQAPWRLRKYYSIRGHIFDLLRDALNNWVRFDPLMRLTYSSATRIYVTSSQTKLMIPKRYRGKTEILLAIGTDDASKAKTRPQIHEVLPYRILYVGRFIDWKGMTLGIRAFAQALKTNPRLHLTLIGTGSEEGRWRALCDGLGIASKVEWTSWLPRQALDASYESHDLLLFPSLHDSGGLVVLEALAHGMPVVCLDLGGPGVIVDQTCGRVIRTTNVSADEVVKNLADSIIEVLNNNGLYADLAQGALIKCSELNWHSLVGKVTYDFVVRDFGKTYNPKIPVKLASFE